MTADTYTEEQLRSLVALVRPFRDGTLELHVHPDEADEVRAHSAVLEELDVVLVENDEQGPEELTLTGSGGL